LVSFSKSVEIIPYKDQMGKKLKQIEKEGKDKYLIVATGHQGEPDAVLSKIVNGKLHFKLSPEDHVIFSCNIIPSPLNEENRETLELKLMEKKARIFRDIHQSGHGSREDHREMINMLRPKKIIPGHIPKERAEPMIELCIEMGYKRKDILVLEDGKKIEV
jgi:ribonuclease J